jgi:hypothetical protein
MSFSLIIPYSPPSYRYSLGVILYKILVGRRSHPYLSKEELAEVSDLTGSAQNLTAASMIIDAPGVMWPEGVKEGYSPALISMVEKLLSRHRDRAGMVEVRD